MTPALDAPFAEVDDVVDALGAQGYIADTRLATTVFLVTRLDQPLLIDGPAGLGHTELTKALPPPPGRGRRGKDRAREGARRRHGPAAAAAAVLRGPGRDQGPLRVGLRQAAALHP